MRNNSELFCVKGEPREKIISGHGYARVSSHFGCPKKGFPVISATLKRSILHYLSP